MDFKQDKASVRHWSNWTKDLCTLGVGFGGKILNTDTQKTTRENTSPNTIKQNTKHQHIYADQESIFHTDPTFLA